MAKYRNTSSVAVVIETIVIALYVNANIALSLVYTPVISVWIKID